MSDIAQKHAEIAQAESELQATQAQLAAAHQSVRDLRAKEAIIQGKISDLTFQVSQLKSGDVQERIANLKQQLISKDAAAAELQKSLEHAFEEKLAFQAQIEKLVVMGDAAGKKQVTYNTPSSRYELTAPRVLSGSSQDPLNQAPVTPSDAFRKLKYGGDATGSTDTLGQGSNSPLVNKDDFKVVGERPVNGTPSARFGEWHRPASKITQPPGGKSSNIFG